MSRCHSTLLDGFTDDWDAALLSEGTLRPTRAASAMNLREVMKKLTKSPVDSVTKEDLENQFSRSMKLLGLERAGASSKSVQKPKVRNVSPRTITRLDKPTVSCEDIRNAVSDGVDRKVLSQAAYERWYFSKLQKERETRQMKGFFDLDKRSKLFEHGLTFNEWLEKKGQERKLRKANPEPSPIEKKTHRRLPMSSEATKEAAVKAYQEWLQKKNEDDVRKKQKLKAEAAARNANKTREDAEKAFEEWKRNCDEKLKKMDLRKKNKDRKLRAKEEDEKERHLQDCDKAFNAWLSTKNQYISEQLDKSRRLSNKMSIAEQRRLEEKKYEAKQAFEDWLEKKLDEEATRVPPPDPKVTKSIQTEPSSRPSSSVKSRSPGPNGPNFPKNLMVPWADFSTRNRLTPQKPRRTPTPTQRKPKVKFADSFDSEALSDLETQSPPAQNRYKDFTKIRQLSDNKSIMMLYHKKDPNCALYYARDLI